MRTVIRPLVPRMEYGLRLFFKRIPYSFILICTILSFVHITSAQSVSCYSRINVSINAGIPTQISLGALTPMTDLTNIVAIAQDRPTLEFTCADVGAEVMVMVRDTITKQQCMVVVNVENKGRLSFTCRDTAVFCFEDMPLPSDVFSIHSCHSLSDLTFLPTQEIDRISFAPGSDTSECIVLKWVAIDPDGGKDSCENRIYIRSLSLDEIHFPDDILIDCSASPSDTSITGGINFSQEQLANCNIGVTSRFLDTIFCLSKTKYIKEWVATTWPSGQMVKDTQYIRVNDSISLQAPMTFDMVQSGCKTGVVLDSFTLNRICLSSFSNKDFNLYSNDIEVYIKNDRVYNIGDTAFLDPGDYTLIYRGIPNACSVNIVPDTIELTVPFLGSGPVLDCGGVVDLAITLDNGESIWIKMDSVFKSLVISSCLPAKIVGRKVNNICSLDTDEFTESLELCPAELLSGQIPGTITIEIAAKDTNDSLSNICLVSIDVQEKVPPVIVPVNDPVITLDSDDMLYTIIQSDLISSLTDNSGCISSVAMTGSGLGVTTGSGLPFLSNGTFFTFDCSHAGMYDVAIFATDCDNNSDTAFTKLTVSSMGCSPRLVSGKVSFAADNQPLEDLQVSLKNVGKSYVTQTDKDGQFNFQPDEALNDASILVRKEDDWKMGLSVFDLKLIQDYILGNRDFLPWQFASADINNSGNITALDIIQIRKIILGLDNNLAKDNMPWLFSELFGEGTYSGFYELVLNASNSDAISIRAAKRGDVSGDVMDILKARSKRELNIQQSIVTDHITHYSINLPAEEDLSAIQFSLEINDGQIGNVLGANEMINYENSRIDVLYYVNNPISADLSNKVEFDVFHGAKGNPALSISNFIDAIWYGQNGEVYDLNLNLTSSPTEITLFPTEIIASPNPTEDRTKISLKENLDLEGDIAINVYDLQGKLIFRKSWNNTNTTRVFPIELPVLPHFGLYIAQIRINEMSDQLYIMKK